MTGLVRYRDTRLRDFYCGVLCGLVIAMILFVAYAP